MDGVYAFCIAGRSWIEKKRYICILIPLSSLSTWRQGSYDFDFDAPDTVFL